jgi:hypothetical protein
VRIAATSTEAADAPAGADDAFGAAEAVVAAGAAGVDGPGAGAALAWPKIADTIFPRTLMRWPSVVR